MISSLAGSRNSGSLGSRYRYSAGTTSRLGIRLKALSIEMGHRSRMATRAHRAQWKAFGPFFQTRRMTATASTSQLAATLRFRIFVKDMAHTSFS